MHTCTHVDLRLLAAGEQPGDRSDSGHPHAAVERVGVGGARRDASWQRHRASRGGFGRVAHFQSAGGDVRRGYWLPCASAPLTQVTR